MHSRTRKAFVAILTLALVTIQAVIANKATDAWETAEREFGLTGAWLWSATTLVTISLLLAMGISALLPPANVPPANERRTQRNRMHIDRFRILATAVMFTLALIASVLVVAYRVAYGTVYVAIFFAALAFLAKTIHPQAQPAHGSASAE